MIARPVIGKPALGAGRQAADEFREGFSRHDLVMRAVQQQCRHVELWRRIERRIHQIDQAVDRRDPRPLDDHRVLGQRPQHRQIVGRLDAEAAAGQRQFREKPHRGK